nr:MAG TPA: hypothetical protein [Caudoviricetes sp.]DAO01905.1 MAG TPA: hypothetical protein [Caudoviricetes sp.]DAT55561.1 MAG TPA: hypothetical protein [Caudoviricetes sp.]DAX93375.1 MAG TPA: hypothetical protein [Bacteriophage sp.]
MIFELTTLYPPRLRVWCFLLIIVYLYRKRFHKKIPF